MENVLVSKAALDALTEQISMLQATVDSLQEQLKEKNQIIQNLNRARFGQSSEKRSYLFCDGQISMFDEAEEGLAQKAPEAVVEEQKTITVAAHQRKAKRTLEELCANLPEEEIIVDLPEE